MKPLCADASGPVAPAPSCPGAHRRPRARLVFVAERQEALGMQDYASAFGMRRSTL